MLRFEAQAAFISQDQTNVAVVPSNFRNLFRPSRGKNAGRAQQRAPKLDFTVSVSIEGPKFEKTGNRVVDEANQIVAKLPVRNQDWWQLADTSTDHNKTSWRSAAEQLDQLSRLAASKPSLKGRSTAFATWSGDCFVALREYEEALNAWSIPLEKGRWSLAASRRLSLKFKTSQPIEAEEIVALFGARLTKFGKDNIAGVVQFLKSRLAAMPVQDRIRLIHRWAENAPRAPRGFSLFNGHMSYVHVPDLECIQFERSATAEIECAEFLREAENAYREDREMPKVGEGWVSETNLFYLIKSALASLTVTAHARPDWLGMQHLDVFIEQLALGVEFQGEQHDRPIEFFGGEVAFEQTLKRDAAKRRKCKKAQVSLLYVRPGFSEGALIEILKVHARGGDLRDGPGIEVAVSKPFH